LAGWFGRVAVDEPLGHGQKVFGARARQAEIIAQEEPAALGVTEAETGDGLEALGRSADNGDARKARSQCCQNEDWRRRFDSAMAPSRLMLGGNGAYALGVISVAVGTGLGQCQRGFSENTLALEHFLHVASASVCFIWHENCRLLQPSTSQLQCAEDVSTFECF